MSATDSDNAKVETPERRKAPPGNKIIDYGKAAATIAVAMLGVAFLKPLVNLAPALTFVAVATASVMWISRGWLLKNREDRHPYDTAYEFLYILAGAFAFVWVANSSTPPSNRTGGALSVLPGVGGLQAAVLPLQPDIRQSLALSSSVQGSDPSAQLRTLENALDSPDVSQREAALALLETTTNTTLQVLGTEKALNSSDVAERAGAIDIVKTSKDPTLRLLGLEMALKEKAGAYIEIVPEEGPDNALRQALHGAAIRVNVVNAQGDNFLGTMRSYDAHASLQAPASLSIGTYVDLSGVGSDVPIGVEAEMNSDGRMVGTARVATRAGTIETAVNISLPRV